MNLRGYLQLAPVVPVLTIEHAGDAVALARALVAGGLRVLEVTLRTAAALDAIRRIAGEVEGAIPAAGTVLTPHDLERATRAGAKLAFSPGLAPFMLSPTEIPVVPGVATASEMMRGMEAGLDSFKFFPAGPAGGPAALKALFGPLPTVRFCPTGGVDADNAASYLGLPNVLCVGGSWVAPTDRVKAHDWATIRALATAATALGAGATRRMP